MKKLLSLLLVLAFGSGIQAKGLTLPNKIQNQTNYPITVTVEGTYQCQSSDDGNSKSEVLLILKKTTKTVQPGSEFHYLNRGCHFKQGSITIEAKGKKPLKLNRSGWYSIVDEKGQLKQFQVAS